MGNEVDRYLASFLAHATETVDSLFVFDDRTSDGSYDVAVDAGCVVVRRADSEASFLEHEGRFRDAALRRFAEAMRPEAGDWVLIVDCDEMLYGPSGDPVLGTLRNAAAQTDLYAGAAGAHVFSLRVDEVWDLFFGVPRVRVDGFWASISGRRFFRWQEPGEGRYPDVAMGCPPEPWYATDGAPVKLPAVRILHFGYADAADRAVKYERYRSRGGHATAHVESIRAKPTLAPLKLARGVLPPVLERAS